MRKGKLSRTKVDGVPNRTLPPDDRPLPLRLSLEESAAIEAFARIPDKRVRKRILDLVLALADQLEATPR